MTGYLQCQGSFLERLIIGPDENQLQAARASEVEGLPLVGHYSFLEQERLLFYRWQGQLRLRFGDSPPIALQGLETEWNTVSGRVDFKLRSRNTVLVARDYPVNVRLAALDQDPTPFVEAEDFDFLLFVHNVIHDSTRAERIYRD